MVGRVTGKTALIIGAGSSGPGFGNGRASAILLAREGAQLFCVDIDEQAAQETANIITGEGLVAVSMRADATRSADIASIVSACQKRFGAIDILVNVVGIAEGGGVVDVEEQDWDRIMAINLKSVYLGMKHVLPIMAMAGRGSIVNLSSIASISYTGVPYSTYYASKGAVNQLTRATAMEYAARGVRVNAVLPGLMRTPMVEAAALLRGAYGQGDVEKMWQTRADQCPTGAAGDGWDVGYAVLYLASDEAKYVTGHLLVVDGGITLGYSGH